MEAQSLLSEVERVYASLCSYRDEGEVAESSEYADGRAFPPTIRPFRTSFARPDYFRFEFSSVLPGSDVRHRTVVRMRAGSVTHWWSLRPPATAMERLSLAVARATGVSGGSALHVPRLLLPDLIRGRRITDLEGATVSGREIVGGEECHVVRGRFGGWRTPPEHVAMFGEGSRRLEAPEVVLRVSIARLVIRSMSKVSRCRDHTDTTHVSYACEVNRPVDRDEPGE